MPKTGQKDLNGGEDYRKHSWSLEEILLEAAKCIGTVLLLSWFFYRSLWAIFPLSAVGVLLWKKDGERKRKEDQRRLMLQFCDCIRNVDASIRAGYSLENAFVASIPDLGLLYGEDALICRELERIRRGLVVNLTIEELLKDLGRRSGVPVIQEFAEVLSVAKRSGGSIPEVIRTSVDLIHRGVEAEEEIYTQIAGKRLEQGIMNVVPFGLGIYLESSNPGYFDTLFHNLPGICIMSACLAAYLAAYCLAQKILGQALEVWD